MNTDTSINNPFPAIQVPYVTADEAAQLLRTELGRMLTLLGSLEPEDWNKPTACTAWNVRDVLAHQAGGYASGISYLEMLRQYSHLPKNGQLPEDAINEHQLLERANKTPAELMTELRQVGPVAIERWAYHFNLIKWITATHKVGGKLSIRHLMWVTHSRDTWMHRLDISRATNRSFHQTPEHDGRITALVMRDVGLAMTGQGNLTPVVFNLTGIAGGFYQVGQGAPATTIEIDALEFNIYASGRMSYEQAVGKAIISGETVAGKSILKNILILY